MNRRGRFGPRPKRASNLTVYLLILVPIVVIFGIGGGLFYMMTSDAPATSHLKDGFRFPEFVPDWLGRAGGGYADDVSVKFRKQLPYVTLNWEVCADTGDPKAAVSLSIALEHREVDLDGQSRTAVEVDGVQGWLSRLDSASFVAPYDYHANDEYGAMAREWDYDRRIYIILLQERRNFLASGLAGPAIALQWNRNGFHYLLFAKDTEPLSAEVLMRIANSLAPAPFPSYNEVVTGPRGC